MSFTTCSSAAQNVAEVLFFHDMPAVCSRWRSQLQPLPPFLRLPLVTASLETTRLSSHQHSDAAKCWFGSEWSLSSPTTTPSPPHPLSTFHTFHIWNVSTTTLAPLSTFHTLHIRPPAVSTFPAPHRSTSISQSIHCNHLGFTRRGRH